MEHSDEVGPSLSIERRDDATSVSYVDSSTLRVFVEFKVRSKSVGGSTAVYYGGNDRARRLMGLSGVGTLLR